MPSASPGYLRLLDHSLPSIAKDAGTIANPLRAAELRQLIQVRLQDLAKLKELTLSDCATEETVREIIRIETPLLQALARCDIFLQDRDLYSQYVVHNKMFRLNESWAERWTRRAVRLGYVLVGLLACRVAYKGLRHIQPHIQSLDL